jgi:hypothetical protein
MKVNLLDHRAEVLALQADLKEARALIQDLGEQLTRANAAAVRMSRRALTAPLARPRSAA